MPSINCFMVRESGHILVYLRRYEASKLSSRTCRSYHNAKILFERRPHEPNTCLSISPPSADMLRHPAWPKNCQECGQAFTDAASSQLFPLRVYVDDLGNEYTERSLPPGAMYNTWWHPHKGPDGLSLTVVTPGGEWNLDGPPSSGSKGWKRTGTPPMITVTPSIIAGSYHGWLRNGQLIDA